MSAGAAKNSIRIVMNSDMRNRATMYRPTTVVPTSSTAFLNVVLGATDQSDETKSSAQDRDQDS